MPVIAVSGAGTILGRRIADALRSTGVASRIVAIDEADLAGPDLKRRVAEAPVVVHAAWSDGTPSTHDVAARTSLNDTRTLLEAAAGARQFVFLSTAAVYGAWADNQVPLTEDAPLRPNPGAAQPVAKAEAERLLSEWAGDHPGSIATVLRPTIVVGGDPSWMTSLLGGLTRVRPRSASRPVQFVHVDDVASAVVAVVREGLEGACNVAADAWLSDETARALVGAGFRIPLPDGLARLVTGAPRALFPYLMHPWVIANDRLRANGWQPTWTAEEALVAAAPASRWQRLSPSRRQEVALGASVVGLGAVAAVVVFIVRRSRRPGRDR